MLFSERLDLSVAYYEWCKTNHVADCALSVITYLDSRGLLKESAPIITEIYEEDTFEDA